MEIIKQELLEARLANLTELKYLNRKLNSMRNSPLKSVRLYHGDINEQLDTFCGDTKSEKELLEKIKQAILITLQDRIAQLLEDHPDLVHKTTDLPYGSF